MMEWQPIETAPRDGTLVILGSNKEVGEGSYVKYSGGGHKVDGWVLSTDHHGLDHYYADIMQHPPTHWMPLPPPPPTD